MKVKFTVNGSPTGKGRPRFQNCGTYVKPYTPNETVMYENLIKTEYRLQCGNFRFDDGAPLEFEVKAYFTIPKSTSKKKTDTMLRNLLRPVKKPDWDNVGKIVSDALNHVAYYDDTQIVDARVVKFYSSIPRIEVTIKIAETQSEEN